MRERIDHLIYAAPDLAAAVAWFADRSGVEPTPGGAHPNWGTRNALVALGPVCYLELIGRDEENPAFSGTRPFRIDEITAPSLVTWAAKASPMEAIVERARQAGYDPGPVFPGSRRKPDGVLLEWSLTMPQFNQGDGLVPFLIDWGDSPHPASTAAEGCTLRSFSLHHPDAKDIQTKLAAIGIDCEVLDATTPYLLAELDTPKGLVELIG